MPLAPILLRYGFPALAAIGVLFGVYTKGRADCAVKHAQEEAKAADKWAGRVTKAAADAYKRGQDAAKKEAKNEQVAKDIAEAAAAEAGADDICLSAEIVEKLRELK